MHELSYMIRLADIALKELKKRPDAIPTELVAEVGELTGVEERYLLEYYPTVVAGTALEGCKLAVIPIPAEALCEDCGEHYHPERTNDYRCPACRSARAHFLHGRELGVRELRVQDR